MQTVSPAHIKSPTSKNLHKILADRAKSGEKFVCYECERKAIYLLRTNQALWWYQFYCTEHARKCSGEVNRKLYWNERLNGNKAGTLVEWRELER